jgi:hypothetical protein
MNRVSRRLNSLPEPNNDGGSGGWGGTVVAMVATVAIMVEAVSNAQVSEECHSPSSIPEYSTFTLNIWNSTFFKMVFTYCGDLLTG